MKPEKGGRKAGDLMSEMGRERIALRAKKTTAVLLVITSFLCLISALASLAGYLPYALEPSVVLTIVSVAGFVASALEARGC
jgi:hypothetical protein